MQFYVSKDHAGPTCTLRTLSHDVFVIYRNYEMVVVQKWEVNLENVLYSESGLIQTRGNIMCV